MSDLIFDSSAFGLVSNWVKGHDDDDGPELAIKDGEKLKGNVKKRMGLGAHVQTQEKTEESVGKLQKLVMGRKKRRQEDEPDDTHAGHATADVDEDDEGEVLESKARVFDRQTTAVTLPSVTDTVNEGVKKKRKKKRKKSHQASSDDAKAVQEQQLHASATDATEKTGQPPEQATKEVSPPQVSKARGQRSARVKGGGGEQRSRPSESSQSSAKASAEDKPRRQKHKTRSKQKNIRRDRRPEDKRPEHLRLGSLGFSGRILTEETKQKLGVGKD